MKLSNALIVKTLFVGAMAFSASTSHASIILLNAENFGGTGLGKVNTILTIQGSNQATSETGSVRFDGTGDIIDGDAKKGESQTQTRTISQLGITSAAGLRIVFNATESDNLINLTGLTLNFYNAAGATLYSANLDKAYTGLTTQSGIGNSGFVFGLDSTQATEAQTRVFNLQNFGAVRIGLAATATGFESGNETFFVAQSSLVGPGGPSTAIPEPGSLGLLGLGFAAAGLMRRRK